MVSAMGRAKNPISARGSAFGSGPETILTPRSASAPSPDQLTSLGSREVVVRAEWLGLSGEASCSCDRATRHAADQRCGDVVGVVTAAGIESTLLPGTRVLVRHRDIVNERWIREDGDIILVPESLEPSIAVLARPLVVARRTANKVSSTARRVLIIGYGELGALVHAELGHRLPQVEITVAEERTRAAELARAFGATVIEIPSGDFDAVIGGVDSRVSTPAEIDVLRLPEPTTDEIASALDTLSREAWRFLPLITHGLTAYELASRGDPPNAHLLHESVKAVVWL